jgi:general secretion pathway protein G
MPNYVPKALRSCALSRLNLVDRKGRIAGFLRILANEVVEKNELFVAIHKEKSTRRLTQRLDGHRVASATSLVGAEETRPYHANKRAGFSLVELLVTMTVLAALAAIAIPRFESYRSNSRNAQAVGDLRVLDNQINSFKTANERWPTSLNEIPRGNMPDPWGRSYQYLQIEGNVKASGFVRKDKNLVPINSDFDLYSMGADGNTSAPLTSASGRDDLVRANDGRYFGLASNY